MSSNQAINTVAVTDNTEMSSVRILRNTHSQDVQRGQKQHRRRRFVRVATGRHGGAVCAQHFSPFTGCALIILLLLCITVCQNERFQFFCVLDSSRRGKPVSVEPTRPHFSCHKTVQEHAAASRMALPLYPVVDQCNVPFPRQTTNALTAQDFTRSYTRYPCLLQLFGCPTGSAILIVVTCATADATVLVCTTSGSAPGTCN